MSFFESIILGLVQGVTEFLPISSTGHLWIFEELIFHMHASLALEIFFHVASLLAVIIFFWKDIWSLLKNFFHPKGEKSERIFASKLLLATAVFGVFAMLLMPFVEDYIDKNIVALTLLVTGVFIIISEHFSPKKSNDFSWLIAFFLGAVQAIAVLPGISRSGITIVFLLLVGIAKKQALKISFLLSIPTILGAALVMLPDIAEYPSDINVLLVGGIAAFLAAFFTIWGMMKYIEKVWVWFSVWCFAIAGVVYFA